MSVREFCPFHTDEDLAGTFVSDEVGWSFTCTRQGHPTPGPFEWLRPPEPTGPDSRDELTGIAADLRLDVTLPAALDATKGTWLEYGLVERAYAAANPTDWQSLVGRYGHTAARKDRHSEGGYTVSAFLGGVLSTLARRGAIAFLLGPATGRWKYNGKTGYYALYPEPAADQTLTWEQAGATVDYVPGQVET